MAAEKPPVTVKRHRKDDPRNCARCATRGVGIPAEWDVKQPGERAVPMCDTHARYWSGILGLMKFPGDK